MQVKCGCFTRNLTWIWFFRRPVIQPSRWFYRFIIFGFYYFSDGPAWDNDGDEKDEQGKYSVDKDDHDDEDSDKEQGDHAPPQKKSKKKPKYRRRRLSFKLMT